MKVLACSYSEGEGGGGKGEGEIKEQDGGDVQVEEKHTAARM